MNENESNEGTPQLSFEELTQYLSKLKTIMTQMQQSDKELTSEETTLYVAAMEQIKNQFSEVKHRIFLRIRTNLLSMEKEDRVAYLKREETPLIKKLSESSLISEDYEICEAIKKVLEERE